MYAKRRVAAALAIGVIAPMVSSSAANAVSSSLVPASVMAKAKANPLSPYPSQAGKLPTVVIGQSVPTMSFAPLEVAEAMNFFGYLGVNVKYSTLSSGTTMQEAVTGGTIDIGADGSTDTAELVAKGLPALAIANIMPQTQQVCVNKTWAQQHGVTANSTVAQKVKALKGATFGITGPGALSDVIGRWLVKTYGGLNPDTDIKSVTVGSSSLAPSVDNNEIQVFLQSAPTCQETTDGEVLISPSQIPQFKAFPNEVLFTTRSYAAKNPSATTRVATAIAMGAKFMFAHQAATVKILAKLYPTLSPAVVASAFKQGILPVARPIITFNSAMWKSVNSILVSGGTISKPLDTAPNTTWTNKYIDEAQANVF